MRLRPTMRTRIVLLMVGQPPLLCSVLVSQPLLDEQSHFHIFFLFLVSLLITASMLGGWREFFALDSGW